MIQLTTHTTAHPSADSPGINGVRSDGAAAIMYYQPDSRVKKDQAFRKEIVFYLNLMIHEFNRLQTFENEVNV